MSKLKAADVRTTSKSLHEMITTAAFLNAVEELREDAALVERARTAPLEFFEARGVKIPKGATLSLPPSVAHGQLCITICTTLLVHICVTVCVGFHTAE